MTGNGGEAVEYVCSHTVHEHQREGGDPQFDHYAIQTLQHKFIRLELHAVDTFETEVTECARDGFALGVEDAGFEGDVDSGFHRVLSITASTSGL